MWPAILPAGQFSGGLWLAQPAEKRDNRSMLSFRGLALFFAAAALLFSQSTRVTDLGPGKLLVASRDLGDPNFAQTVVLLVHYGEDSVMGLIINRPTKVPLSRAFDELASAKDRSDPVYSGGPVEKTVALGLLRSRNRPEDAENIFSDIHLIAGAKLLEKTLAAGTEASKFHVYAGYSGWTVGQLQMEVRLGAWHIFRADAALVFDPDPESIWSRLIRKTEERIAGLRQALYFARPSTIPGHTVLLVP